MLHNTLFFLAAAAHALSAVSPKAARAGKKPKGSPAPAAHPCLDAAGCGCRVEGADFASPATAKRAKAVLEPLLQAPLEVVCGPAFGWRTQARLAAAPGARLKATLKGRRGKTRNWRAAEVQLGLYKARSHDVAPMPDCKAHAPAVNAAALAVSRACAAAGVVAVKDGEGHLRYTQFAVDPASQKTALSLVWNARTPKDAAPELPRLLAALEKEPLWHSIWVNYRGDKPGNAIFDHGPRAWARLRGPEYVRTKLFGPGAGLDFAEKAAAHDVDTDLELRFSPRVFRQANLAAFAGLVAALAPWVPGGADLCELYAGVGALGLALRPRCARVRCSESNPNAADAFALAAEDQDRRLPDLGPVRFRALDAADAVVADAPGADVLLVDPPRRGLCPEVLEALLDEREDAPAADVRRLIYVSCGFDALERDLARLLAGRRWGLTHAEAHVFFPGSDHVETLAVLDRR